MELEELGGAGSWELGGVGRCWEELGVGSWELGGAAGTAVAGTVGTSGDCRGFVGSWAMGSSGGAPATPGRHSDPR